MVGCVTGDTLIRTNKGDLRIDSLFEVDKSKPNTFFEIDDEELLVFDGQVYRKPIAGYYNGFKEVVTITTRDYKKKITCTLNHRLGGINGWIYAGDIKEGDLLIVFDEDDRALPDYVESVERSEAETYDLAMDEYEAESFGSMRYIDNNGVMARL